MSRTDAARLGAAFPRETERTRGLLAAELPKEANAGTAFPREMERIRGFPESLLVMPELLDVAPGARPSSASS